MKTQADIQPFIDRVLDWADGQASVLGVLLVGSYAREQAKENSDIDLVLLVDNPSQYLSDTRWVQRFGIPERQQQEDYGALTSLRVWYQGGPEVEFGLTTPAWASLPMDEGTRQVLLDGYKLLYERTEWLSHIFEENLT